MSARAFGRRLESTLFTLGVDPLDDVVVFGSAVMKLHGLKERIGDVDLFVSARTYARLRARGEWEEQRPREDDPPLLEAEANDLTIHAFHAWASRDRWIDVPEAFARAERVEGVLCVPLQLVAEYKRVALSIVRGWHCDAPGCEFGKVIVRGGDGVARGRDCPSCGGTGRFKVEGSPWEKHERDLALLEAAGVAA